MRNFVKTISALNISFSIPVFVLLIISVFLTLFIGTVHFTPTQSHEIPTFCITAFVIEALIALWLIISDVISFKQAININANYWSGKFSLVFLNFIACSFITLWVLGIIFTQLHLSILNPIVLGVGFISLLPLLLLSND
ncbi:MAG TPA: hypothetical protein DDW90_06575 [Cyanobacteria bacterium UBA9971]|nr:hypothetical protein [Cyanobacteria bacterium UBA9971]